MRTTAAVTMMMLSTLARADFTSDAFRIDTRHCGHTSCPEAYNCQDIDFFDGSERDPSWGPCQPPPHLPNGTGCKQIIIGRFKYTDRAGHELPAAQTTRGYLGCPGYIVLNSNEWTQHLNDQFIGCAAKAEFGATCKPAIKVVSPSEAIPDPDPQQGSVTSTEVCQLHSCGCVHSSRSTGPINSIPGHCGG